ncbi:hypothetical protein H477_2789 [[Clostridium] sordellii ATCC 9714]|nr:hypothetical protein H477_2789 [[Clostridium] sordellii ATCC 9714] [Paeniclostridium sordellii ATCC 9714]
MAKHSQFNAFLNSFSACSASFAHVSSNFIRSLHMDLEDSKQIHAFYIPYPSLYMSLLFYMVLLAYMAHTFYEPAFYMDRNKLLFFF